VDATETEIVRVILEHADRYDKLKHNVSLVLTPVTSAVGTVSVEDVVLMVGHYARRQRQTDSQLPKRRIYIQTEKMLPTFHVKCHQM
jgi:hypothetical protein